MTRNYYTPSNYDYSTFGGYIYNYDYDGYNSMSNIAARIISDKNFDKKCKENIESRKRRIKKGE